MGQPLSVYQVRPTQLDRWSKLLQEEAQAEVVLQWLVSSNSLQVMLPGA